MAETAEEENTPRILIPAEEGGRNLRCLHGTIAPSSVHSTPAGRASHEGTRCANVPSYHGWLRNVFHGLTFAVAQTPTLMKACLFTAEEHPIHQPTVSRNPVLFGPVECVEFLYASATFPWRSLWPIEREQRKFSPKHGKERSLVWTTHPHRLQPNTDTSWVETGTNHSSHWAKLRVV